VPGGRCESHLSASRVAEPIHVPGSAGRSAVDGDVRDFLHALSSRRRAGAMGEALEWAPGPWPEARIDAWILAQGAAIPGPGIFFGGKSIKFHNSLDFSIDKPIEIRYTIYNNHLHSHLEMERR